jgi:dihydrofolate synthase / folylpolyglutamate synthase
VTPALAYLESLQGSGIRPGVGRIRAILRRLGRPERAYQSIVVAGTNGKGSTSAMLASILIASGYRTALYTSPHLVDIRERWMIGGAVIDDALLDASVDKLRAAADAAGITPTYFEAMTLIAFIAFRIAECDVAVLEVGMGGRLDATNVVRPIAAVITPIGFDHMEYLGNTLRKIATEKAGVIHRGSIALTSNADAQVVRVIRRRAERFGASLQIVTGEHDTPLSGLFQRRNAALAVRTAEALSSRLTRITPESIERGVAQTRWRGRLECLRRGRQQIWIDGCHNAHAIAVIAPFIERTLPRPRALVFGIMADKDVEAVGRALFPLFDRVITTEPFPPRSVGADHLARLAGQLGIEATAEPNPQAAFARVIEVPENTVFIGGSLYLAGSAIAFFDSHSE